MQPINAEYGEHLRQRLVQTQVPPHLHAGLIQYIGARRQVGGFLTAVLQNNLSAAVGRADEDGHAALPRLVCFLVNYAPSLCWGSPDHVETWLSDTQPVPEVFE